MVIPVCRGEFGLKVYHHVPYVHALPGPKIVEIEEGEEALYPSAAEYRVVGRGKDDKRRGLNGWRLPDGANMERFVPEPIESYGLRADIVVCPRMRNYGRSKNWMHWPWLVQRLHATGFRVWAAGAADSSDRRVDCYASWHWPRPLDATIELMRTARLVIATDAGLAHLAVLCGAPLLVITHKGLVAPGPVLDASGKVLKPAYWPVKMHRYAEANHTNSPITTVDGWDQPQNVLSRAVDSLRQEA